MTRGAYDSGVLINGSIGPVMYRKEPNHIRWQRIPECGHPERDHAANGMCQSCYNGFKYKDKNRSNYHTDPVLREKILAKQRLRYTKSPIGKCAICLLENKKLFKDHSHTTNLNRGLICSNCNFILGHAKDSIETLKRAIEYLERYNGMFAE